MEPLDPYETGKFSRIGIDVVFYDCTSITDYLAHKDDHDLKRGVDGIAAVVRGPHIMQVQKLHTEDDHFFADNSFEETKQYLEEEFADDPEVSKSLVESISGLQELLTGQNTFFGYIRESLVRSEEHAHVLIYKETVPDLFLPEEFDSYTVNLQTPVLFYPHDWENDGIYLTQFPPDQGPGFKLPKLPILPEKEKV